MSRHRQLIFRDLSLIIGFFILVFLGALAISSGRTGSISVGKRIGERLRSFAENEIRSGDLLITEGAIIESIDTIVRRFEKAPQIEVPTVSVLVIRSDLVNAMTFPGGLIVVYTGLVELLSGADEFAAILAHEMGHAANRDPTRQLIRSAGIGVVTLLIGSGGEVLIERIIREAVGLSYARRYELRADEYALTILEQSGIDPGALGRALEQIKSIIPDGGSQMARYLDPHEDIDERIARSMARSGNGGYDTIDISWEEVLSD